MKNVILITTDQQRYDTLSCNGNGFIHTPNLDRLAAQGARFTRAYCSNPVCTPSRVSIMTGLLPSRHGSYNIGTSVSCVRRFLSTYLTERGYRTHQLGKAHFYPWDVPSPETRPVKNGEPYTDFAGFETAELCVGHSDWGVSGHYEAWLNEKGIFRGRQMPQLKVRRLMENDAYQTADWGMPAKYHSGAWIVDRTEAFLKERPAGRPFYLNIGFQDPHHPLTLPSDWPKIPEERVTEPSRSFDRRVGPLKSLYEGTVIQDCGGRFGIAGNQDTVWRDVSDADKKKARSYYYSMVELFDHQIGQLTDIMKKYGVYENTLLIVTSDHGDMLFDHGLGEKGPMAFEEVLRVPLIVSLPGKIFPQTADTPVSLTDLYPTILDYLDMDCPVDCDGLSLRGLLSGAPLDRKGVRAEFKEEKDAVRYRCFITKDWKLAEYPGMSWGELYHLAQDMGEETNLYFEPEYLPVKYELLKMLLHEQDRSDPLAERPCRC